VVGVPSGRFNSWPTVLSQTVLMATDHTVRSRPATGSLRERVDGGTLGNARLTGSAGLILLLLLFVEGVTVLLLRPLLSVHVFVGMLLIPPVGLKLASTGYRFARYYTNSPTYRREGPPQLLLRVIAPFVVCRPSRCLGLALRCSCLGRVIVGWWDCTRRASSSGSS
jgi:hypothetical protein